MSAQAILVTGGTGAQGGATIDTLLERGLPVRALVRDPSSPKSVGLAARGVELAKGDFHDVASLNAAMKNVGRVFSMQTHSPTVPDGEVRAGRNLIQAALRAGVEMFVHTSVARAGDQQAFVGWKEGRWSADYWDSKSQVNDAVRAAGFKRWVVLKPAYMMANCIPPTSRFMYPTLETQGEIFSAMAPDTRLDLIDSADIGRFAAAAFMDPDRFNRQEIDLASEALTMSEIGEAISRATSKSVKVTHGTPHEVIARGYTPALVRSDEWCKVEGYKVDTAKAGSFGVKLNGFGAFAQQNSDTFLIGGQ